jgi:hypothetical protein
MRGHAAAHVFALPRHLGAKSRDGTAIRPVGSVPFRQVVGYEIAQRGLTDRAAVERFETVLAAGQSAAISIPRGAGEAPVRVVLSNAGDYLHIAEPNAAVTGR